MKKKSISYVIDYTPGDTGQDRLGGLPTHLPTYWPRCQGCLERMEFMGQIYSRDWFPIDENE